MRKPVKRVVSFKIDDYELEMLEDFARRKGLCRSEVIRRAIQQYIKLEDKNYTPNPRIVRLQS